MKEKIDIGKEIQRQLTIKKRSKSWLAKEVGCDPSNFNKQLNLPHINTGLLYDISVVMEIDFFVFYSKKLCEDS